MNKTEQAQQLRLAAEILETGHPFEFQDGGEWIRAITITPDHAICERRQIRPILATPPDGRPLHNPDNLTAEQVGVGYRLPLANEDPHPLAEVHVNPSWKRRDEADLEKPYGYWHPRDTYRLPLLVPWPEAPKPELPPFQLPPPPPGMKWHREDGWKEGDLPQGYRPLAKGERIQLGDEGVSWDGFVKFRDIIGKYPFEKARSTRLLTFTHEGKLWMWHRPGDPMPCDGRCIVAVVFQDSHVTNYLQTADGWSWGQHGDYDTIIGWRYAETTKPIELGPEDVPPCSVVSGVESRWLSITCCHKDGVYVQNSEDNLNLLTWSELLRDGVKINRSIPLTGKWDANAWEPCSKEVPA